MSDDAKVRIVKIEASKVASFRSLGKHPEKDAFAVMVDWTQQQGLIGKKTTRFFGFDNPGPSTGKSYYGYEVWVTVGSDAKGSDVIKVKDFPGGHYAVMTTELSRIGEAWKELVAWCRSSDYEESTRQCLEEALELPTEVAHDGLKINIMLPIEAV